MNVSLCLFPSTDAAAASGSKLAFDYSRSFLEQTIAGRRPRSRFFTSRPLLLCAADRVDFSPPGHLAEGLPAGRDCDEADRAKVGQGSQDGEEVDPADDREPFEGDEGQEEERLGEGRRREATLREEARDLRAVQVGSTG